MQDYFASLLNRSISHYLGIEETQAGASLALLFAFTRIGRNFVSRAPRLTESYTVFDFILVSSVVDHWRLENKMDRVLESRDVEKQLKIKKILCDELVR